MSGAGAAVAVPFTLFISLIELLVAFLQAFLFTMLTSVFLGMAMAEHHHEEAH
jgi:F-type H+-transporting ATPase subunit a